MYRAWLAGKVSRSDLLPVPETMPTLDLLDPDSRAAYIEAVEGQEIGPPPAALKDPDVVDAVLHDPGQGWTPEATPRPLRTATVRELPLGTLLTRVRRAIAANWRSGVMAPRTAAHPIAIELDEELRGMPGIPLEDREQVSAERERLEQRLWDLLQSVKRHSGYDDELIKERDELSRLFKELEEREGPRPELRRAPPPTFASAEIDADQFMRLTQQAAGSFSAPGRKAGRPTKFSPAQLELVAKTYREAYASGSPSPTKDVAEKLGLSRSQAAKLVMRCRDHRIGLLGPTKARRAGGLEWPRSGSEAGSETP